MKFLKRLHFSFLVAVLAATTLAACETAPATGRTIFTGGLSAEKEAALGAQEHEKIVPQFGGSYDELPELNAYVSSVGSLLAQTSELPDLEFRFTVLDSPIINAFALPGGYIYVTRGLLSLAENEAEVAGVLAHEIGHVTARHSAERYGKSLTAALATIGAGILLGGEAAQVVGTGGQLYVRSYSRDQEFEADKLGVRYLTRAGYDPKAMGSFLAKMQEHARLQAEIAGKPGQADEFDIMQTHPRTADRVQRAIQQAGIVTVPDPIVARDIYLRKIDRLLYGDNPDQGLIRGQEFAHPVLRFRFEVPDGFRLINAAEYVGAAGPKGSQIILDLVKKPYSGDLRGYIRDVWAKNQELKGLSRFDVNGMAAAGAVTQVNTRAGARDLRLVAIRYDKDRIYRFMFVTPPALTKSLDADFRRTVYSFRKLSQAAAQALKPKRLLVRRARAGDSVQGLAYRMPFDSFQEQRFRVLNGLGPRDALRSGMLYKTVVE